MIIAEKSNCSNRKNNKYRRSQKTREENISTELTKNDVKYLDFVIYRTSAIELRLLPTNKNVEKLKKFLEVLSLEINAMKLKNNMLKI